MLSHKGWEPTQADMNNVYSLANRLQQDNKLCEHEWKWFETTFTDQINIRFSEYNNVFTKQAMLFIKMNKLIHRVSPAIGTQIIRFAIDYYKKHKNDIKLPTLYADYSIRIMPGDTRNKIETISDWYLCRQHVEQIIQQLQKPLSQSEYQNELNYYRYFCFSNNYRHDLLLYAARMLINGDINHTALYSGLNNKSKQFLKIYNTRKRLITCDRSELKWIASSTSLDVLNRISQYLTFNYYLQNRSDVLRMLQTTFYTYRYVNKTDKSTNRVHIDVSSKKQRISEQIEKSFVASDLGLISYYNVNLSKFNTFSKLKHYFEKFVYPSLNSSMKFRDKMCWNKLYFNDSQL